MGETKNGSGVIGQAAKSGVGESGWATFLGVVCLVILCANLGRAGFFEPDESRNAEKAREILLLNDWVTPHHNFLPTLDKPIASYWPVALSFKLFGFSEWAARLPSALAALGCLLLVYQFARRHWEARTALWSCLVLATSVEFFFFARLVILDMSLTFFITLALFSFYSAVRAEEARSRFFHSVAMYAALGAGTLIKGAVAVAVPGMVIFFYLLMTRQWSLLPRLGLARGALIYCAIVIPPYLWMEARNPGYLRYFLWEEHFVRYVTPEFNRSQGWYYFILVLAAGFFPWSALLPLAAGDMWRKKFADSNRFLAIWSLLPLIFFSFSKSQLPQYILPIFPALALGIGRFLAENFLGAGARRWSLVSAPWVFVIAVMSYLLVGVAWPNLLARQARTAVALNTSSIAVSGVLFLVILGVFFSGYRRNWWRGWDAVYISTATGMALFFIVLGQLMASASIARGSRSLAQVSAPFIASGDRVAFYDTYVPGITFYLAGDKPQWLAQSEEKDRIMGSNYLAARRPLAADGHGQVLYSFSEFAQQWHRQDLVLRVFVKEKNLQRLSLDVGATPRILTKHGEYLLVTNR